MFNQRHFFLAKAFSTASPIAGDTTTSVQGSYAVLKTVEKVVIFQSGKKYFFGLLVWKKKMIF